MQDVERPHPNMATLIMRAFLITTFVAVATSTMCFTGGDRLVECGEPAGEPYCCGSEGNYYCCDSSYHTHLEPGSIVLIVLAIFFLLMCVVKCYCVPKCQEKPEDRQQLQHEWTRGSTNESQNPGFVYQPDQTQFHLSHAQFHGNSAQYPGHAQSHANSAQYSGLAQFHANSAQSHPANNRQGTDMNASYI